MTEPLSGVLRSLPTESWTPGFPRRLSACTRVPHREGNFMGGPHAQFLPERGVERGTRVQGTVRYPLSYHRLYWWNRRKTLSMCYCQGEDNCNGTWWWCHSMRHGSENFRGPNERSNRLHIWLMQPETPSCDTGVYCMLGVRWVCSNPNRSISHHFIMGQKRSQIMDSLWGALLVFLRECSPDREKTIPS